MNTLDREKYGLTKRIRTLLYEDQAVTPSELEILHTPAMQRLYDLKQLGTTDRVFVDASHSRFHHVIGAVEQATRIATAVVRNLRQTPQVGDPQGRSLKFGDQAVSADEMSLQVEKRIPIIRLIALLHDLTHAPYGHTVEDDIGLVQSKHDDPDRQADAFYRLVCQYLGWLLVECEKLPMEVDGNSDQSEFLSALERYLLQPETDPPPAHERLSELAAHLLRASESTSKPSPWRIRPREIAEVLLHLHVAMTALLHLELLHSKDPNPSLIPASTYPFRELIEGILNELGYAHRLHELAFNPQRDAYMLDIVGNTVCADLLDYAKRDSHFSNLHLDYDSNRITENFTLVHWNACRYDGDGFDDQRADIPNDPFGGLCIRTAISVYSHKLRTDVLGELMNLLNVRFYLYERVIYNPTKCAVDAMLGTALQLIGYRHLTPGDPGEDDLLPIRLRHTGDALFLDSIATAAGIAVRDLVQSSKAPLIVSSLNAESNSADSVLLAQHLANDILARHSEAISNGADSASLRQHISAGRLLLARVRSRRLYRPIFRVLRNACTTSGQKINTRNVAKFFHDAKKRFAFERRIENEAKLPLGTVVIHCPRSTTARKVANVLIAAPKHADGKYEVKKLKDLADLDSATFSKHQEATRALTGMYESMWRFTVYVAPFYLQQYEVLSQTIGLLLAKQFEAGTADTVEPWPNDDNLKAELRYRAIEATSRSALSDDWDSSAETEMDSALPDGLRSALLELSGKPPTEDHLPKLTDGKGAWLSYLSPDTRKTEEPIELADIYGLIQQIEVNGSSKDLHKAVRNRLGAKLDSLDASQLEVLSKRLSNVIRFTPSELLAARKNSSNYNKVVLNMLDSLLRSI